MSDIKTWERKLRHAADALADLFEADRVQPKATPEIAREIRKTIRKQRKKRKYTKKALHWTQRPENKAKLSKRMKSIWRKKRKSLTAKLKAGRKAREAARESATPAVH